MMQRSRLRRRLTDVPFIQVENLTRVFDVSRPWLERLTQRIPRHHLVAAANVSFAIGRRETFGLVGESGSGKSTIARMIVGLIPPSGGSVAIDGTPVTVRVRSAARQQARRRVQMVFQDPYSSLNPRWRAFDIIAEPIRAFRLCSSQSVTKTRVEELLHLVGLDPVDGLKYPHEFSGGQRQRIAIARALASQPEFIVCDEPTSALDVSVQAQVLNLMRDLQDRLGLSYLLISHNLAVVRHMASRVGVMYLGRIVEMAPSKELFRNPHHPYTRMLLDAVPHLERDRTHGEAVVGEMANPLDPPTGCPFHPRCPHVNERCQVEPPRLIAMGSSSVSCHAVEEQRI
jgi:peptide/nickel transport system ATP-binding protein